MRDYIKILLRENLQQAEKTYFNTGELNNEVKEGILSITHGDGFTRLVCDLAYHFGKMGSIKFTRDKVFYDNFYRQLKEYDKNVFPVAGDLENYNATNTNHFHVIDLVEMLSAREPCVKYLKRLPSIAIRNMTKDIKTPRNNQVWFKQMSEQMGKLVGILKMIPDNERTKPLLQKIFNSKHNLAQMLVVAEHYQYAFTGAQAENDKQTILDNVRYTDAEVIQDSNNIMVVRINSQEAMSTIGCTSQWCFARPNALEYWFEYMESGFAYLIFDFNKSPEESTAMMSYLPDTDEVYVSTNVKLDDVGIKMNDRKYLEVIGVDMTTLIANMQDTSKGQKRDYDEVDIYNEQNRKTIKNILFEAINKTH